MHHNNVLDDEELLVLQNGNSRRRNLHMGLPCARYDRFNLEEMAEFRFKKLEIYQLVDVFQYRKLTADEAVSRTGVTIATDDLVDKFSDP